LLSFEFISAIKAAILPNIKAVRIDPKITIRAEYTIWMVYVGIISLPSKSKMA